ncbi:MAG: hypothetical protein M5U31_00815 [Acidimicrobiia bacterium]|nr:hypothetical protein [Acidimicrobiia bacterium]
MAGCPACGSTQVFRKSNVVYEVGSGGTGAVVRKRKDRFLPCTLDVCGGCGRLTTYVQDPQDWAKRTGAEEFGSGASGSA